MIELIAVAVAALVTAWIVRKRQGEDAGRDWSEPPRCPTCGQIVAEDAKAKHNA